ncbi:uncharacterized protein LOC134844356 [Symsagittifera roscoffensis]|uniref:uncharacterized protein LOC134844356 n=1 Tax=Symsagittifera roscoffensis TaxID=84072 RepID=UPI00307BFE56
MVRYFSTLYVFLIIGLIIHNISCHEFVYQKRQPISTPLFNSDYNELYDWQNFELRKPDGGVEWSKSGKSQAALFSPSVERAIKMLDQLNFQMTYHPFWREETDYPKIHARRIDWPNAILASQISRLTETQKKLEQHHQRRSPSNSRFQQKNYIQPLISAPLNNNHLSKRSMIDDCYWKDFVFCSAMLKKQSG